MGTIPLIIGTRGSRLALAQAGWVQAALPVPAELSVIRTLGDRDQTSPLQHIGDGQGFFTREIERALLDRRVDVAVHSLKDLPVQCTAGLQLAAVPAREGVADLLLVRPDALERGAAGLPLRPGARVATSALRRQTLLLELRPDLEPVPIRGNVPTRIAKVERGEADALVLARAGLARLALSPAPLLAFELDPGWWVAAPGQAALGVQVRADDAHTAAAVVSMDDEATHAAVDTERALLLESGGGCHTAFGAWARAVPGGWALDMVMPTPGGGLARFHATAADLNTLRAGASAWVRTHGSGPSPQPPPESWICRPASGWC